VTGVSPPEGPRRSGKEITRTQLNKVTDTATDTATVAGTAADAVTGSVAGSATVAVTVADAASATVVDTPRILNRDAAESAERRLLNRLVMCLTYP
jgi:hypothetical protein